MPSCQKRLQRFVKGPFSKTDLTWNTIAAIISGNCYLMLMTSNGLELLLKKRITKSIVLLMKKKIKRCIKPL